MGVHDEKGKVLALKQTIKLFCPPILLKALVKLRKNRLAYSGNYSSWAEAQLNSTGYNADEILQRVLSSSRKVVTGEAVYERDSVCFNEKNYRWPLLACLLKIANKQNNQLSIVDFGGSLGSLYFQHKDFLSDIDQLDWSVVEQAHFVTAGQKEFENNQLHFHFTLAESIKNRASNTVLLSSVLQYLEDPKALLKNIAAMGFRYVLIDRTPFIMAEKDRLTIQSIPQSIYSGSYPAWFFSSNQFDRLMENLGYRCVCEFNCEDDVGVGTFKGFLFEKIENQAS